MNESIQAVQRILLEALEVNDPQQRAAFVAEACGTDAQLRQEVEQLLEAEAGIGQFLPDQPLTNAARAALPPVPKALGGSEAGAPAAPVTERPGDSIGRYRLLQRIGEGGCGLVYLAQQEEPVQREVALKVIKLGMDTRQVVARFEAERQALALMDHPNIARVFDGGATTTGRPYFVMELVRGARITHYCDQHRLSTAERLELFVQVCQAVQHAHQKGIIHRDLKPSNILVAVNDGVAVPKVIDFGIAKATEGRLTDHTLCTTFAQFLGTPAYMSPEQTQRHLQSRGASFVGFGGEQFLAIGRTGIMASADGVNWSAPTGLNANLNALCYGNGRVLAVGLGGAVLESGSIVTLSLGPGPQGSLTLSLTGPTGSAYTVESSTNLVSWQFVTNLLGIPSMTLPLDRPSTSTDRRFYRAYSR